MWGRSTGNSAATFVNWMFNLAVSMSFLSLTEVLTKEGEYTTWNQADLTLKMLLFWCPLSLRFLRILVSHKFLYCIAVYHNVHFNGNDKGFNMLLLLL